MNAALNRKSCFQQVFFAPFRLFLVTFLSLRDLSSSYVTLSLHRTLFIIVIQQQVVSSGIFDLILSTLNDELLLSLCSSAVCGSVGSVPDS